MSAMSFSNMLHDRDINLSGMVNHPSLNIGNTSGNENYNPYGNFQPHAPALGAHKRSIDEVTSSTDDNSYDMSPMPNPHHAWSGSSTPSPISINIKRTVTPAQLQALAERHGMNDQQRVHLNHVAEMGKQMPYEPLMLALLNITLHYQTQNKMDALLQHIRSFDTAVSSLATQVTQAWTLSQDTKDVLVTYCKAAMADCGRLDFTGGHRDVQVSLRNPAVAAALGIAADLQNPSRALKIDKYVQKQCLGSRNQIRTYLIAHEAPAMQRQLDTYTRDFYARFAPNTLLTASDNKMARCAIRCAELRRYARANPDSLKIDEKDAADSDPNNDGQPPVKRGRKAAPKPAGFWAGFQGELKAKGLKYGSTDIKHVGWHEHIKDLLDEDHKLYGGLDTSSMLGATMSETAPTRYTLESLTGPFSAPNVPAPYNNGPGATSNAAQITSDIGYNYMM